MSEGLSIIITCVVICVSLMFWLMTTLMLNRRKNKIQREKGKIIKLKS